MTYRISVVVERSGVPGMTLRSWERRYGFPRPKRTRSGYRTYSDEDLRQVLAVKALLDNGALVSEAIELVRKGKAEVPAAPAVLLDTLFSAAQEMSELGLERVVAHAEATLEPELFCSAFVLPAFKRAAEELDIAREHLATAVLRNHLRRAIERVAPAKHGAPVVLACPEGEEHEGGLLAIAMQLRLRGVRTVLLGANTPSDAIGVAAVTTEARGIGISLVSMRKDATLKRVVSEVVAQAHGKPVVAGGVVARRRLKIIYAAGAMFADTADEMLELLR